MFTQKDFWGRGLQFYMYLDYTGKDKVQAVTDFEITERDAYDSSTEPVCTMSGQDAQELFDQMWTMGMRPSDGDASIGQLAATQKHLSDMRKIVENKLKVVL